MYDSRLSQPTTGISYSAMARPVPVAKRSVGTQTTIVRCRCQEEAEVDDVEEEVQQVEMTEASVSVQTEADSQATMMPADSPRTSAKAAAIIAANKARIADKQATASAVKQAGLAKQGTKPISPPSRPPNTGNGGKPKPAGNTSNKTGAPERVPKGSQDPIRNFNKHASMSHESMDSLDPTDVPVVARGATANRGRRNTSEAKPA